MRCPVCGERSDAPACSVTSFVGLTPGHAAQLELARYHGGLVLRDDLLHAAEQRIGDALSANGYTLETCPLLPRMRARMSADWTAHLDVDADQFVKTMGFFYYLEAQHAVQ